jgi:hypothetical protein
MGADLRGKLASERIPTTWRDLDASGHLPNLVLVDGDLDLVDAGVALAENDVARVRGWLAAGRLRRPTAAELEAWCADPDALFELLIVRPFVLVQRGVTLV